jgi:hypothetical protein
MQTDDATQSRRKSAARSQIKDLRPPPRYVSTMVYAKRHGVSVQSVQDWLREGRVEGICFNRRMYIDDNRSPVSVGFKFKPRTIEHYPVMLGVEVAVLLGVTPRWVRKLARKHRIAELTIGGHRRYSVHDVRRLMAIRKMHLDHPKAKKIREVVLAWAIKELSKEVPAE